MIVVIDWLDSIVTSQNCNDMPLPQLLVFENILAHYMNLMISIIIEHRYMDGKINLKIQLFLQFSIYCHEVTDPT